MHPSSATSPPAISRDPCHTIAVPAPAASFRPRCRCPCEQSRPARPASAAASQLGRPGKNGRPHPTPACASRRKYRRSQQVIDGGPRRTIAAVASGRASCGIVSADSVRLPKPAAFPGMRLKSQKFFQPLCRRAHGGDMPTLSHTCACEKFTCCAAFRGTKKSGDMRYYTPPVNDAC